MIKFITTLLILHFSYKSFAQNQIKEELPEYIKEYLKPLGNDAEITFSKINLINNNEQSHHNQKPWILASTTKALTCHYAIAKLGINFQFATKIYTQGKIESGILTGDIIISPDGDPSLLINHIQEIIFNLKNKGIKAIKGNFIVDLSKQINTIKISSLGKDEDAYNSGLSSLNFGFNRAEWILESNTPVMLHPTNYVSLQKNNSELSNEFHRSESTQEIEKWTYSTIESSKGELPIGNPSLYFFNMFVYMAKINQIETNLKYLTKKINTENMKLLAILKSDPLKTLCFSTLEYSNNLYAEQILLKATDQKTIKESSNLLMNYLKKLNLNNIQLENGSGLTIHNKADAKSMAEFIKYIYPLDLKEGGIIPILSANTVNGFLYKKLRKSNLSLKVWAKTGSIDYINNLVGIFYSKSHGPTAFFLGIADYNKRSLLNEAHGKTYRQLELEAKAFKKESDDVIEKILEKWIEN